MTPAGPLHLLQPGIAPATPGTLTAAGHGRPEHIAPATPGTLTAAGHGRTHHGEKSLLAAAVVAFGLAVPTPAVAAPACAQVERYAAQSGAELLRLNKLDPRPTGDETGTSDDRLHPQERGGPSADPRGADQRQADPRAGGGSGRVSGVAIGAVKSAHVATASPNAAAVTRMLGTADRSEITTTLLQQAPPTNAEPAVRTTKATKAGTLTLGTGTLSAHAQWAPGMGCAATVGDVTRAEATLSKARIGRGALVDVPMPGRSLSTTKLERHADAARTVASASIRMDRVELLGGAVRVRIVKPPRLTTTMSTSDGGEVRYVPAVVEVSGEGVKTTELNTAGDNVELTLPAPLPESLLRVGDLAGGSPLALPGVPDLPSLRAPESAGVTGPGTTLRISLGGVRQATEGHAIAARASAIRIALSQGKPGQRYAGSAPAVVLDTDIGVLEAAAVAPEPDGAGGGDVEGATAGLPVTGPRVDVLALAGVGLLVSGAAALVFGMRRRRFRA